jgi:uncharacterized protein
MLLDLNKLHGPREHVERTLPASVFDPPDEDYRVAAPVELSMGVSRAGDAAFAVTGQVRTRLELACSRCLDAFEAPVDASFELRYVPESENVGPVRAGHEGAAGHDTDAGGGGEHDERELAEDDLTTAFYRDGMLDIIDLLREQFQLALPMKPLCSDACRGLCARCGTNLNRTECGCAPAWEDPRLAPLKSLLNRPKEN